MNVINLSFIRTPNGMFWYAVDKIRSLGIDLESHVVVVKPGLESLVQRELPSAHVLARSRIRFIQDIFQWLVLYGRQVRLVTFTPHPIPFFRRQTIAFYDDYPFRGRFGWAKRLLFALAAKSSGCRVGIINRSVAIPFLERCGVAPDRIFFDTAFPAVEIAKLPVRSRETGPVPVVGLVGTDSEKKNYDAIFDAVASLQLTGELRFLIYGGENRYVESLRRNHRAVHFEIVPSDEVDIPVFLNSVDYLVSAATAEGYGRPMGLAVVMGVPLFLLRAPVFLEFFGEHALFFDNVPEMMTFIVKSKPPATALLPDATMGATLRSPFFVQD